MIYVHTQNAIYSVDRENNRWMRFSPNDERRDDLDWISGGFTLGEVGERCFAHYDPPRDDGAVGRWTSPVFAIYDEVTE